MIFGLRWWLAVLLLAGGIAIGYYVIPFHSDRPSFDCGSEGKAALDGNACIDREPVLIP